jgi:hypothetical protein
VFSLSSTSLSAYEVLTTDGTGNVITDAVVGGSVIFPGQTDVIGTHSVVFNNNNNVLYVDGMPSGTLAPTASAATNSNLAPASCPAAVTSYLPATAPVAGGFGSVITFTMGSSTPSAYELVTTNSAGSAVTEAVVEGITLTAGQTNVIGAYSVAFNNANNELYMDGTPSVTLAPPPANSNLWAAYTTTIYSYSPGANGTFGPTSYITITANASRASGSGSFPGSSQPLAATLTETTTVASGNSAAGVAAGGSNTQAAGSIPTASSTPVTPPVAADPNALAAELEIKPGGFCSGCYAGQREQRTNCPQQYQFELLAHYLRKYNHYNLGLWVQPFEEAGFLSFYFDLQYYTKLLGRPGRRKSYFRIGGRYSEQRHGAKLCAHYLCKQYLRPVNAALYDLPDIRLQLDCACHRQPERYLQHLLHGPGVCCSGQRYYHAIRCGLK